MKKLLLLLLTCSLTIGVAAAATAKVAPVRLDPSFGEGGKATVAFPAQSTGNLGVKYELPFQYTPGHIEMAAAPGGKLVVAGSTKIVRFLPNGKLDRGFGAGGMVTIARPPGMSFVLAGVAVDSLGRTLVAGSARPLPTSTMLDPLLSSAAVMRFAADGSVDRSFGSEGALISDLGIKPPAVPTGSYTGASVGVRSLVVDSLNRPLITGGSVTKASSCGAGGTLSTAFIGRLTEAGALDPGFGTGGLRQIADLASLAQGSLIPAGMLFTIGSSNPRCGSEGGGPDVVLAGFGPEGALDPGFGFAGSRSIGYSEPPAATIAPSGKIVLLGVRKERSQMVTRLLPNGAPDPSFGRIGRAVIDLPRAAGFGAVAVDGRGRLLFAGRISHRISKNSGIRRSTFLLARMYARGGFDRAFGRHGSVQTGFGGPASSFATQVMVDGRGRILVGGGVSDPRLGTGGGFALARYLTR
jgi:uncharacterized delta-60 repeat protein